ncbi:MAG: branched-chain amino acid transport system II carrier protein [Eubacteriales bacterium]|nr:branched-chain amino acid transport system II carrier protein [Eubacteriales bacterium]
MKEKLTTKQYLLISTLLFGMFFGAGNLIVPPMTGKLAGQNVWITMLFFCVTAVVLPVMGVIAVAKSGGLKNLASRVDAKFAAVFTAAIYLSIGPALGIPRAGSVPFEMAIKPYLPEMLTGRWSLFVYTVIFFGVAYWLSLTPSKLVERMGKVITPSLLGLMAVLFIVSLVKGMPQMEAPLKEAYQTHASLQGFIDGYMTMDTIAALNFGLVISMVIYELKIKDEKEMIKVTVKSGMMAGGLLVLIYFLLAYLGAASVSMFPDTTNGAQILGRVSMHLLGTGGTVLQGAIFTLACLTTCVGLITSSGKYFTTLSNKLSYKSWATIWTLLSFVFANIGLDAIMKYNITILFILYPISIVLIVLALTDKWMESNPLIYRATIYTTAVISAVGALQSEMGIEIPAVYALFAKLPLHGFKLGWVIPAIVVLLVTYGLKLMGVGDKAEAKL